MGKPLRVLFLEDVEDDMLLMLRELQRGGFEPEYVRVDTAPAMENALRTQSWDVIIADYSMPGFTALDGLRILQQSGLDLPFILVSGTAGEETAVAAMKAGAHDYLTKDALARLAPAVERELREAAVRRERHQALAALAESERRYRTLFDQAGDIVFVVSRQGRFLDVNRTTCERLGYSREELLRMGPAEINAAPFRDDVARRIQRIFEQGSLLFETELLHRDGRRIPVEVHSCVTEYDRQPAILSVVRDLTERRRLEEQLRQAQKMEAMGRLAGGVAHDFNNLLTVISGYTNLALRRLAPDDSLRGDLSRILDATERAATLTRQLLAFSRRGSWQPVRLDLNRVIKDFLKMLERMIGEDVRTVVQLAPDLHPLLGDPGHLEQVLMNLAVNARDAMPTGGQLVIATANTRLEHADVSRLGCDLQPGDYVQLTVSDDGVGMDEETRRHVFEPFFTTKPAGKGTGLGLAVVFGIVTQHGGHIAVDSQSGRGTTFRIYLPACQSPAEEQMQAAAQAAGESAGALAGTETVLLAEDEESIRSLMQLALEGYGYRVLAADSAGQALQLVRTRRERVALLVSDVVMPDMSGPALYDALRAEVPQLKVLFLSGYSSERLREHGLPAEATLLSKPFGLLDLVRKVRQVLDTRLSP